MPDAGAYNIGGAYPGAQAGAAARAETSAAADAARRAAMEAVRIGDQRTLREATVSLMTTGDVVPATDYEEPEPDEETTPEEEQSEIDSGDEDSPSMEGWDDESYERPENPLKPSGDASDESDALESHDPYRILVEDGVCCFEIPVFWNIRPVTRIGESFVADRERMFNLMTAVADWLSNNRKDFLLDPDPWNLGVSALEEFNDGWASAVQKDFLVRAKLDHFAGSDLFSRDIRSTSLVFDEGSLPLGFLFDDDARMAWVAQVVKQLTRQQNGDMKQVLEDYSDVTVPRGGRQDLINANLSDLDFRGLIARACALAGGNQPVSWKDTIRMFKSQML